MQNVKNTMVDRLLGLVAPHLCYGCGKTGSLLCSHCKYDIVSQPFLACVQCGEPVASGICKKHRRSYDTIWVVGVRSGALQRLIGGFKFQNVRAAAPILAELLNARLPSLDRGVLVPVPTSPAHIRERGYDHMALVTRALAHLRGLPVERLVGRQRMTVQHHSSRQERMMQAESAFRLQGTVDPTKHYIVVDDVYTTGSTVEAMAALLKHAGAQKVSVAVIARQLSTD